MDFYPNNGTDQPHCHNDENDPSVAAVCDHVSAYMYFMEVNIVLFSANNIVTFRKIQLKLDL